MLPEGGSNTLCVAGIVTFLERAAFTDGFRERGPNRGAAAWSVDVLMPLEGVGGSVLMRSEGVGSNASVAGSVGDVLMPSVEGGRLVRDVFMLSEGVVSCDALLSEEVARGMLLVDAFMLLEGGGVSCIDVLMSSEGVVGGLLVLLVGDTLVLSEGVVGDTSVLLEGVVGDGIAI